MANEVAKIPSYSEIQLSEDGRPILTSLGASFAVAKYLDETQMLPAKMSVQQAAGAIFFGNRIGLDVMSSVQNIAVINGRPAIWGDACGAIVQSLLEDEFEEEVGEGEEYKVVYHVKRRGRSREVVREFGFKDAKRAGLWGKQGPWSQYPKRMMMIRARAFAYRDAFPDLLKGIRIVEEENDAPIDITTKATVSPSPLAETTAAITSDGTTHELPKKTSASDILKKAQEGKGAKKEDAPSVEENKKPEPEKVLSKGKTEDTPDELFAK